MALNESALSELLGALRAADGFDLTRELAQWALRACQMVCVRGRVVT